MYLFYITTTQDLCIFYLHEVMNAGSESDAQKFNNQKNPVFEFENRFL